MGGGFIRVDAACRACGGGGWHHTQSNDTMWFLIANHLQTDQTQTQPQQVNEYQSRLRSVTRKIMAAVSELSMYQVGA